MKTMFAKVFAEDEIAVIRTGYLTLAFRSKELARKEEDFAQYLDEPPVGVGVRLGRGHDVFVIDWGAPGPEDRYLGFDDYAGDFLARALERCCAEARSERAHVLGYCLGGTLAVAHAAAFAREGRVASLALLAAPVRFDDGGLLSVWMRSPAFDPRATAQAHAPLSYPRPRERSLLCSAP